jgi:cytochrome c oxidase cbb3-type subunit 3
MKAIQKLFLLMLVALPQFLRAQDAVEAVPSRPIPGQHFGLPDEIWLWLFMATAVVFTMIIITINTSIKNLAEAKSLWKSKKAASLVLLLLTSTFAFGQEEAAEATPFILSDQAFWGMAAANAFLMFFALLQLRLLRMVTKKVAGIVEEEPTYINEEERESSFSRFWKWINDLRDQEHEKDLLLNHDYDGIKELDNNLPPWWTWTFYLSIVFGIIYLMHFHVLKTGDLPHAELAIAIEEGEQAVADFKARANLNVDETNVKYILEDARLAAGSSIYVTHCKVCHGAGGEGGVGPNLTDNYWIHGGSIGEVFSTIKYGVPAKGMQAWKSNLTAVQIQNVSTFILSMQGTNPPNPKAPQGDLVEPAVPEGAEPASEQPEAQPVDSTATAEAASPLEEGAPLQ